MYSKFADCSKTSQGLTALRNTLYAEVYGDWLQCLNLINYYDRENMKNQGKQIHDYECIIQNYTPVILGGEVFEGL